MQMFSKKWLIAPFILLIENFILYQDYWFNGVGPGRDFPVTYHAMPFHWIQRAIELDFAQWVPTVAMGYPIQMDPQSAMFYPVLWLFVLFKIPYTLTAAVVVQLLHIYLGAIGTYVLLKALKFDFKIALFGAICFQMIGGFQHVSHDPDIIRGYALYPWLLFSLIYVGNKRLSLFLIPFVFYLFITGVYPGNVTALFFVSVFFILLYVMLDNEMDKKTKAFFLLNRAGLAILGIVMASVWLLPILLNKSELARMNVDMVILQRHFFKIENFFTTVFNAKTPGLEKYQDITMRSLFVGSGVLLPLGFIAWPDFRKVFAWVFLIYSAWFLGCGNYFYHYTAMVFPPLLFSRFLTSDYLPAIVLPLIVLSAFGLQNLLNSGATRFRLSIVLVLLVAFVVVGKSVMHITLDDSLNSALGILSMAILILIIFLLFWKPHFLPHKTNGFLCLLILVNGMDFYRAVESNSRAWKVQDYDNWYIQKTKFDTKTFSPGLSRWIVKGAPLRPERLFTDDEFYWRGWLTGEFSMIDYGITLQRAMNILMDEKEDLRTFMMKQSEGHLVATTNQNLTFPELIKTDNDQCGQFKYLHYTLSEVELSFSLNRPCLFLHNELFFPGWIGNLIYPNGDAHNIEAFGAANGLLRAYHLPKGDFKLKESFTITGFKLGGVLSLLGLLVWCYLLVSSTLSYKRLKKCKQI